MQTDIGIKENDQDILNSIQTILSERNLTFFPSQAKLSIPLIIRIYKRMKLGIQFDDIKVYENVIIDGHHRFISSILAGYSIKNVDSLKPEGTDQADWNKVELIDISYYDNSKINNFNKLDAAELKITVEELLELVK